MKIKLNNKELNNLIGKYQEGGQVAPDQMPAEAPAEAPAEGAPVEGAPAEGEDPTQMIMQAASQAVQTQDCNIALQVCQALLQMMGGQEAPAEAPGQPVYKKGGKLVKWI